MANFMKGFNQGFSPHVRNIGDLISNSILEKAKFEREQNAKKTNALIESQNKALEDAYQNKIYDEVLNGDLTNFRNLSKENRVAVNQELDHKAPKKLYQRELDPEKGYRYVEYTVPKDGGEPQARELSVAPVVVGENTYESNGKIVTDYTLSSGKVLKNRKVKPIAKPQKETRTPREVFHDPKTSTEDFLKKTVQEIRILNQSKKTLSELYDEGLDGTSSFINAKSKYEKDKIKIVGEISDLFSDRRLAEDLNEFFNMNQKAWDAIYKYQIQAYLEGDIDATEKKDITLMHLLYLARFGKINQSIKDYH